jgi:uncharacterized protein involved in exopolysaccharide biosynthesis
VTNAAVDNGDMLVRQISPLALLNALLRWRRVIALGAILAALAMTTFTLVRPRTWSSTSVFMPQSRRLPGNLAGLASQFGLSLPGAEPTQSPAFYADLVVSRQILEAVVDSPYAPPAPASLAKAVRARGRSEALKREDAIERLGERLRVAPNQRTGIVTVTVSLPTPALAQQVNDRLLALVNDFNQRTRQSQARAERRFAEQRREEVRRELRAAEDRMQRFLASNRAGLNSPMLTFENERLQRELRLQQQLLTSATESYEQARVEEVRDTPVITVIETPQVPVRPDPRRLVAKILLALLAGALIGIFVAIVLESMLRGSAGTLTELEEFRALRAELAAQIRSPLKALRRGGPAERTP